MSMDRISERSIQHVASFLDIPSTGKFGPVSRVIMECCANDLESWNRRGEHIDLIWRIIHPQLQLDATRCNMNMQRRQRAFFARRFCEARSRSKPFFTVQNLLFRNCIAIKDMDYFSSACASPAPSALCQHPLIPLQKFIITLEIPTTGEPLYISGRQRSDGKIMLSKKQITALQKQWDGETVGDCWGRPKLILHISNGETGATMSLPLTVPSGYHGNSMDDLHVLSSNHDFVTKCFAPGAHAPGDDNHLEGFCTDTGVCFGFEHDLQKLMVNHPLAQILLGCKFHGGYNTNSGRQECDDKLLSILNVAAVLEDRNGNHTREDEGLILSGYLDFSQVDSPHFKLNLTRHYRNYHHSYNDRIEDDFSFDIMSDSVLSSVLNCVNEMHVQKDTIWCTV